MCNLRNALAPVALLLLPLLGAGGRLEAQGTAVPPAEDVMEVASAPVEIDGVVLFRVRGVSSLPAETRARAITARIVDAAADPAVTIASVRAAEVAGSTRIFAGEHLIMAVVDADATFEGVPRADTALAHVLRIQQAIGEYREARSARAMWRAGVVTTFATALLAAMLAGVWWFWRRLDDVLRSRVGEHIHGVEIKSFEILRAASLRAALRSVSHVIRGLVLLSIGLVYLCVVLGQWPWSRTLSKHLVAFTLAPLRTIGSGIAANLPNLLFLLVLFVVVRIILRVARLFFDAVRAGTVTLAGFDSDWAQPTYKIMRIAVIAFALIVAYPYIPGSGSAAFKGVSLFIGVLFSFGSSSAISNVIAGYTMTYRRAFKVGDCVRIGESVGQVVETHLQVTHLRSLKNEEITIPNSQILAGEVLNYSALTRDRGLILHTEVGIGYETPWRQVEAMLLAAAARTPGLATELAPFVLIKNLGDFAAMYELNVYCRDATKMQALYTLLHHNVLDLFNEYGVQIMTPAYQEDPAQPKIVSPQNWYAAPAPHPADVQVAPIEHQEPAVTR